MNNFNSDTYVCIQSFENCSIFLVLQYNIFGCRLHTTIDVEITLRQTKEVLFYIYCIYVL